ncbi:MAG: helix-turn-helix domain-containing protein [Pseudomonadota bacterium]
MAFVQHQPQANRDAVLSSVVSQGELGTWEDVKNARSTRKAKIGVHKIIFHEGDEARSLYELVSGAAMLYKLLPDGRRQVVEVLGPGDLFGFDVAGRHGSSAETLISTEVMVYCRREIEDSIGAQSHVARCALHQVGAMHDHAVLLGRKSAYERVATFLMRFLQDPQARERKSQQPQARRVGRVSLHMTRQEMADYLGLTIETVSRVISDMKRKQVIYLEKHDKIVVSDIGALFQLTGAYPD